MLNLVTLVIYYVYLTITMLFQKCTARQSRLRLDYTLYYVSRFDYVETALAKAPCNYQAWFAKSAYFGLI